VQEVSGDHHPGLSGEKLAPAGSGVPRRRIDPGVMKDLPDGGLGDPVPELEQLALDALVAPPRVVQGHAQDQCFDRRCGQWTARRTPVMERGIPGSLMAVCRESPAVIHVRSGREWLDYRTVW